MSSKKCGDEKGFPNGKGIYLCKECRLKKEGGEK
jgi:hypothetical protein